MGIGITQEQRELADAVRGWAARAVPPEERRKVLEAPPGQAPPAYWEGLAVQGLCGVHLPEEAGGGGGTLLDLAVVLEETGRAALPGPFLPHVLAAELLRAGGAASGLTGALGAGERIGAAALESGSLTAVAVEGGGHVLDGVAPPVTGGAQADLLVLAAETATGTVWLAADAATLEVREQPSADPLRPAAEVRASGVTVPGDRVLELDGRYVRDLARTLYAAEACGIAAWTLETAVEHAKTREQFGRPIGQFQAVKHLCADMLVRLEQARALTWDAARAVRDEGAEAGTAAGAGSGAEADARGLTVALAASAALEAAYTCAKDCVQILGGIGFTWEHDAHLYLRRALAVRQALGTGGAHRLRAARLAANGARRELRMELPAEAERFRAAAREALAGVRGLDDPAAVRRALAPTGYAAPHLPEPYGLGAGPVQQLAVQQELKESGIKVSDLGIATWVVPSLLTFGTEAQRACHLGRTLSGEVSWCQLFSEPEAGSDLAALRTRAVPDPETGGWRIDGQKVWTSGAATADWGILLARTDPEAPKHKGLTFFVVDMKHTPGVDVRPLKEITGDALFNEVYFDGALLPADAVIGEVNDGWKVARHTLGNERVHMADQVTFSTGLEALIGRLDAVDGSVQERIGGLAAEAHALGCIGLRTTLQQVEGLDPGAGASVRKLVQTPHQQKIAELGLELLGPRGALTEGPGAAAVQGFLMSRCLTIAGGTTQVQLNVVAERLLGLPRDPEPGQEPRPLID